MNGILGPAEPAPTTVAPVTTTKPNGGKMYNNVIIKSKYKTFFLSILHLFLKSLLVTKKSY